MAGPLYNPNGIPHVGYVLPPGVTRGRILAEQARKRQEELGATGRAPYAWEVTNPVSPNYTPNTFDQAQAAADGYQPMQPQAPNAPEQFSTTEPRDIGGSTPPDSTASFSGAKPEDKWSSTGKTDSFGAWFNKPQASDALTAFGAAMLKAPTFLQGLGDAALAVNAVDREYRMPTSEEIARANMKARIASGKGAYTPKTIQTGYDDNGNPVTQIMKADGSLAWFDHTNQEMPQGPTNGFIRSQDSGASQRGKDNEKYRTVARDKADQAIQNLATYDEILATAPNSGTGSGMLEKMVRGLSSVAGMDLGDVDLTDKQVLDKNVSNLELQKAQTQKGLGQFTEMEREIVRKSLPAIDTNLETVLRVTVQMKLRDQLDIELYNDYMDIPDGERPTSFENWAYKKRQQQRRDYKQRYEQLLQEEIEANPAYKAYAKGSKTGNSSIIDEADAIVNGN